MFGTAIESTTLRSADYHAADQVLFLEFRTGAAYCYFGVPQSMYQDLMGSGSKGAYFNRNIRGRFPYRKLVDVRQPLTGSDAAFLLINKPKDPQPANLPDYSIARPRSHE